MEHVGSQARLAAGADPHPAATPLTRLTSVFFQGPATGGAFVVSPPARLAADIWQHAVRAMAPATLVASAVQAHPSGLLINGDLLPTAEFRRCLVLAVGKAAAGMVQGLLPALPLPVSGLVVVPHGYDTPALPLWQVTAGHPVPDQGSVHAAQVVMQLAQTTTSDDLVFVLLSGGASALLADPVPGVSLEDLQATTGTLLASGAPIGAINAVRKHLSRLKGGGLAALLAPARVVTLAISDVPDDRLDVIASGPTTPDPSTFADAWAVLAHTTLAVPESVRHYLHAGLQGHVPETPKGAEPFWAQQDAYVIGGRQTLLAAAAAAARAAGLAVVVAEAPLCGEAARMGEAVVTELRALMPVERPTCWLAAGETTVTLSSVYGRGGRNQELALAAAVALRDQAGLGLLAAGTDGIDGPTDAAGAWVDGTTLARGLALGHDAVTSLCRHDAYGYFAECGGHWRPGPTGTNVSDLLVGLVWPEDGGGRHGGGLAG